MSTRPPQFVIQRYENPNVVKVVVSVAGQALYFSRRTIRICAKPPVVGERTVGGISFLKHVGDFGYRRETLLRLVKFPVSQLERREAEQLRALENGIRLPW